jgi:hypothetical protein
MSGIWRFFKSDRGRWCWQKLSLDSVVIAESAVSYATYDSCIAAARSNGYVFESSQACGARPGNDELHNTC